MRTAVWKVYVGPDATEYPTDPLASAKIGFGNADVYIDDTNYTDYRLSVKKGGIVYSFERWFRIIWLDDDTTSITEAKLYLTGNVASGAYLRIGTASSYRQPTNTLNPETALKTYGYPGGLNEIVSSDPNTWLTVPVKQEGNLYVTDYIVAQLVLDGNYLQTLNVFNNLQFNLWYKEV